MNVWGGSASWNMQNNIIRISFSLNFKMFYNGGELVCDASSLEECKNIGNKPQESKKQPPKNTNAMCVSSLSILVNRSYIWVKNPELSLLCLMIQLKRFLMLLDMLGTGTVFWEIKMGVFTSCLFLLSVGLQQPINVLFGVRTSACIALEPKNPMLKSWGTMNVPTFNWHSQLFCLCQLPCCTTCLREIHEHIGSVTS